MNTYVQILWSTGNVKIYSICDAMVGSWNVMLMLLMSDPFKYSHSMPVWTRHSFQTQRSALWSPLFEMSMLISEGRPETFESIGRVFRHPGVGE